MMSADRLAESRRLLALAWPVMLSSLNWTILHVTDVIVVGLTGTREVAALGASRALTYIGIVVVLGWLSGILVFVSRADGAGDKPASGRVLYQGLAAGLALAVLVGGALYWFAHPLLLAVGVDPLIAPDAARVVSTMALAYPGQLIMVASTFFLEGVSRPRRVALVNLSTLPVNALLAWAWSGGHLGFPALGAVGAAAATATASALGAAGMLIAIWTLPDAVDRGVRRPTGQSLGAFGRGIAALLGFGAVPALASGLELAGFSILIALSTRLGETATHAFQIVFSIHNVTFAFALGLGSAAGVRAGNAVGEGVPLAGVARAWLAVGLAAGVTGVLAVALLVGGAGVVGLFPASPQVTAMALAMLAIWVPFILFDGIQVVLVYALRSLGDQVAAGINGILAFFVVTGGAGLALIAAGWAETALVAASAIGMVAAALLNAVRLAVIARRLARAPA